MKRMVLWFLVGLISLLFAFYSCSAIPSSSSSSSSASSTNSTSSSIFSSSLASSSNSSSLTSSIISSESSSSSTSSIVSSISSSATPAWQAVFEDNFNRADTTNGDLGENWSVNNYDIPGNNIVISNNSIYTIATNNINMIAHYISNINYSTVRVSLKCYLYTNQNNGEGGSVDLLIHSTGVFPNPETNFMGMNLNWMPTDGYLAVLSTGDYTNYQIWLFRLSPVTLLLTSEYFGVKHMEDNYFVFSVNSGTMTATVEDSNHVVLFTTNVTDPGTALTSGKVGMMPGRYRCKTVDDFKIEKFE